MRLTVTTPLSVAVDAGDVVHLRAEDKTGALGSCQGTRIF